MLGIAIGCIRLSYDDFCRLTRDEFQHIYKAYHEKLEAEYRDDWQRTRMLAAIVIQPHTKQKITPEKLLPFPWDSSKRKRADRPQPTAEESRQRFEALIQGFKK